jgi:transaldolase
MGASFRNVGEIKALAGVDFLTISPKLLEELKNSTDEVPKKLDSHNGMFILKFSYPHECDSRGYVASAAPIEKISYVDDEPEFRWALLQDQMAFDKLHEGIKGFAADGETLQHIIKEKIAGKKL